MAEGEAAPPSYSTVSGGTDGAKIPVQTGVSCLDLSPFVPQYLTNNLGYFLG